MGVGVAGRCLSRLFKGLARSLPLKFLWALSRFTQMRNVLPYPEDLLLAQRCLEGEEAAIVELQERHRATILNYLVHAGASLEEAEGLTHDLWADILMERPLRPPRLATYAGDSPLQAWLKAVALNNLIRQKRIEARRKNVVREEPVTDDDLDAGRQSSGVPDEPNGLVEEPLLEIMRGAVEAAFRQCAPQDFVLVQLAHANGLRGRELSRMFGCSEAKVSRDLEDARRKIVKVTLAYVRERDPWLELKWEDFIELCRAVSPSCFGVE